MVWWKSGHAFDMVSIDAFKTSKKRSDVGYVLSPVTASICMFVILQMPDDAAIAMLPEFRPKIQFALPSEVVLVKRCEYLLRNTYLNPP
ncbi:hypothetical protein Tco_1200200 [Tanacetum coccineum]